MFLHGGAAVTVSAQSKRPVHSLAGSTRNVKDSPRRGKSGISGISGIDPTPSGRGRGGIGGGWQLAVRGEGRRRGRVACCADPAFRSPPWLAVWMHWRYALDALDGGTGCSGFQKSRWPCPLQKGSRRPFIETSAIHSDPWRRAGSSRCRRTG
jgi:hypothetical protein